MKYVIIEDCFPIIFCEAFKHSDFARTAHGKPTSAGFCSFEEVPTPENHPTIFTKTMKKVTAWGESVSLGIKSGKNDADIIAEMLNE